ncbi:XVIPCD domain-containing protein [Luteibacter sp. 22Crub2.1]|uniref:XVIPCD domain-containing protein n=1 Tax=Luteibacter sp. 22Crub2.1 TaxID=1283288 RepID=UPI0009A63DCE|nr:XVIPCD domain-containing protein [Luteibacter sp. 22Crub2.1]SKB45039.1 Lipase (class 3) [Luteibacter sp. 22Crub2.1]
MTFKSTDYALLAQDAYNDPVLDKSTILDGVEYKAIDTMNNPRTGFQATAYERVDTGEVVIAYRGTEFDREPVQDGGVDAAMVLTGINLQTADSEAFTKRVLAAAKEKSETYGTPLNVTVTGHSLGGTLAEINASRFGLHGETFNAYGAAGLNQGIPSGGSQVIDHVRAGDVVAAASPHFGEVRVYATEKDIDTLSKAGYRDDSTLLSPRNPVKAIDFDAHAIDNFTPINPRLGHSIMDAESQARYRAHEGMVDRYRNDVRDIRMGLSAAWEIPKAIGEFKDAVEHRVVDAVGAGVLAVEHGFEHLKEGVQHVGHEISQGIHAVEEKAHSAWNTLTHPGSWLAHDKPGVPLNDPDHPDHLMFRQARSAVHELDRAQGRQPDGISENIAGSMVVKARQDGLERIDKAVLSDDASRIYGVQGAMESPLKRVAELPTEQAARTSVAESSDAWIAAAQAAQGRQNAQVAQQQPPSRDPSQPSHGL